MKKLDAFAIGFLVVGYILQRAIATKIPYSYRQSIGDILEYVTDRQ